MKMRELIDALPSLRKISEQELSAKTLYRVSKMMKKLENELNFYDKHRRKLIEDYCEEKDGRSEPKQECRETFEKEFMELLELEITPDDFMPIAIPEEENIRLSYSDLCSLEKFITIKFTEEE